MLLPGFTSGGLVRVIFGDKLQRGDNLRSDNRREDTEEGAARKYEKSDACRMLSGGRESCIDVALLGGGQFPCDAVPSLEPSFVPKVHTI